MQNQKKINNLWAVAGMFSWLTIFAAIYLTFFYAPREKTMGDIQRIFYFHVPSAWIAFLSFFIVFICSILVLIKKDMKWDSLAVTAAEIGFLFTTVVLTTGPLWARPVWYVWWTWDIRLTSTLILWLIFGGYFLLRDFVADKYARARLSAIIGILAFVDIPIVYFSIHLWRTQHPSPVIAGNKGSGLDPQMKFVFFFSLFAFMILLTFLLFISYQIKQQRGELENLKMVLEEKGEF